MKHQNTHLIMAKPEFRKWPNVQANVVGFFFSLIHSASLFIL